MDPAAAQYVIRINGHHGATGLSTGARSRAQAVTFEITFDACLSAGAVTAEEVVKSHV
jgi:hypothetical protein